MREKIEKKLNVKQYGFIKGKSTIDALKDVKDQVCDGKHKYGMIIFVDFEGAFDTVNWEIVIEELKN